MLVGRDVALRAGEAALQSALQGTGTLLLVGGEAGIGKTTVATTLAGHAETAEAFVRWGGCWEGGELIPFLPWISALRTSSDDECAEAAARLEAGTSETDPDTGVAHRARLFAHVVEALRQASAHRPQVVVLEDLHWADSSSLDLLRAVAPHLPVLPVLVIATYRADELDAAATFGAIGGGAEWIPLEGLGEDDVSALLADALGRTPEPDETRQVRRQTGGNPLLVTQVARLMASGSAGIPAGVRGVLDRRLARLPSNCHDVLGVASVLGTEFDARDVVDVSGLSEADVLAALDFAVDAGVCAPAPQQPGHWMFVHALLRNVRYEGLGTAQKRDLHRRAVEALSGRASAGIVAHHAALARFDPEDPRPAELAMAAALEAAQRMAWNETIELCERALGAAPQGDAGDDVRIRALRTLGDARLRRGDAAGAGAAFRALAALGRSRAEPEVIARAALGFAAGLAGFEVRLFDPAQVELLEEAVAALDAASPMRPLVLARLSVALSFVGSDERRLALAEEAATAARARGDDVALAAALAARCDVLAGPDHVDDRLDMSAEIVACGERARDLRLQLLGRRLRAVALLERRDLADFEAEVAAFERDSERLGDPLYGWYVPLWRAMLAHADGRLGDARRLLAEARDVGHRGGSENAQLLGFVLAGWLAMDEQDADAADAEWTATVRASGGLSDHPAMAIGQAIVDSLAGRTDHARPAVEHFLGNDLDAVPRDQEWLATLAQTIMVAVRVDVGSALRPVYEALLPYAGVGVFEGVAAFDHGVVDRFLALAAAHIGETGAVSRHVDAALAGVAGAGKLLVARTQADCARALRATGDSAHRQRAEQLVKEATATYRSLGLPDPFAAAGGPPTRGGHGASFVREGDVWSITYQGRTVSVRHAKGIADLAMLLANPGRDVHVRTLEGVPDLPGFSAQPAIDDEAVRHYRTRLAELEAELDDADRHGDSIRSEKLTAERDALVNELARSMGKGGRRRAAGSDPDERLRKAVSARVKASIERIGAVHAALGSHLRRSVRTGFRCCYDPEAGPEWTVVAEVAEVAN